MFVDDPSIVDGIHEYTQELMEGGVSTFLPFTLLPFHPLSFLLPPLFSLPLPHFPLKVGSPINQLECLGEHWLCE